MEPRVLYGLHERFVLLPYARGAKRARLVLRINALRRFCLTYYANTPLAVGAPMVLGELLNARGMHASQILPQLRSGAQLNALKRQGVMEWLLRHHRVRFVGDDMFRFESGSRTVYAAHTEYYSRDFLVALCDAADRSARAGFS